MSRLGLGVGLHWPALRGIQELEEINMLDKMRGEHEAYVPTIRSDARRRVGSEGATKDCEDVIFQHCL